jgi:amidophosphoribosyltransferase
VPEICAHIGADTLAFVSLEGLTMASTQPADRLCRACFTGEYPIALPEQDLIGKHVLEGINRSVQPDEITANGTGPSPDGVLSGQGAADALNRP